MGQLGKGNACGRLRARGRRWRCSKIKAHFRKKKKKKKKKRSVFPQWFLLHILTPHQILIIFKKKKKFDRRNFTKKNFFDHFFSRMLPTSKNWYSSKTFVKFRRSKFFFFFLATSKIDILPKFLSNSAGQNSFYIFLFTISFTHFNFKKRQFLTKIVDLLHPNAPIFVRLSVCGFFCPFSMLICP